MFKKKKLSGLVSPNKLNNQSMQANVEQA